MKDVEKGVQNLAEKLGRLKNDFGNVKEVSNKAINLYDFFL